MKNSKSFIKQEFETTVIKINPQEIIEKLRQIGACEEPEVLLRRWVYDIHPTEPEWVRLRDNGHNTTLTYKRRGNREVGSTTEIETEVMDFDKAAEILSKIHFYCSRYQENKRQIFRLNDIEFSIDKWPKLEPYLEIEATSLDKVQEGLRLLNLEGKDSGDLDVVTLFEEKGITLNSYAVFKFSEQIPL